MEARTSPEPKPQLFISELVPHEKVARILSENGLWQLTLSEIVSNKDALKGGSYWLRDEEKLPPRGTYEVTDSKKEAFVPASKERLDIVEWSRILQIQGYHDPHRPMTIEVCGPEGMGKLVVAEVETMFETVAGVVGRKLAASSLVSSAAIGNGEFLEITLTDGTKKRVYDAKEVKIIRTDPGEPPRQQAGPPAPAPASPAVPPEHPIVATHPS
jgi:hypothetical protein